MGAKIPAVGKLAKVYWTDIVGFTNVTANTVKPAKAITIGYIHKDASDYIVIATSYFTDKVLTEDEREGDFTAMPKGLINKIEII